MSPVTYSEMPPDPRLTDLRPPGVIAAERRAHQELADLRRWRDYDVQWQVFHRLRVLSANHSNQAWQRRYRGPLAPYALAYLFTQPAAKVEADAARVTEVHAATRLWKAGPESQHPIPLLSALIEQVRGRDPRLPWDLREEIANRSDPGMAVDAAYLGLGLSTLDTNTGTFAQVCQTASTELDIPGGILFVSTRSSDKPDDQQVIVADRRGATDMNVTTIHTYQGLTRYQHSSPYPFAEVYWKTLYGESGQGQLLRWMWELDRALCLADMTNRTMSSARRESQRRLP
jgi:hypothetical protein